MSYDPELPGCFDDGRLTLATGPIGKECAFAWLTLLRQRGGTWAEVKFQIEAFLRERDASTFHILDQIDRAAILFKPWLYGPDNDE